MHSCNGRNFNIDAAAADLCDIYKLNYIAEFYAKNYSENIFGGGLFKKDEIVK